MSDTHHQNNLNENYDENINEIWENPEINWDSFQSLQDKMDWKCKDVDNCDLLFSNHPYMSINFNEPLNLNLSPNISLAACAMTHLVQSSSGPRVMSI